MPHTSRSRTRDRQLHIWVSEREYALIKAIAARMNKNLSTLTRQLLAGSVAGQNASRQTASRRTRNERAREVESQ
jgi:hypothetical protein